MSLLERIWIAYLLTVITVAVLAAPQADPAYLPLPFLLSHTALLAAVLVLSRKAPHLTDSQARISRCALLFCGMPLIFSSMGWILPAVHPDPFEFTWIDWDRALFGGGDPSAMAQALLSPWFTELLQWVYASFYFIPLLALVGAAVWSGWPAFDRVLTTVVFCFMVSYLGYLLWPTLPPYLFLHYDQPIEGVWLATDIHKLLDTLEGNRWDCFPSGHTMLSLVSLILCWRHARRLVPILTPVVALMILSTVALRYHYAVDVFAGTLLAWPAVRLCDWLLAAGEERDLETVEPPRRLTENP